MAVESDCHSPLSIIFSKGSPCSSKSSAAPTLNEWPLSGRWFESVFKSCSGESISADEQGALDSVMASRGHNHTSLRPEAIRKSIKELEVIDRLIERQFKNMRLLMQAYESVRFDCGNIQGYVEAIKHITSNYKFD